MHETLTCSKTLEPELLCTHIYIYICIYIYIYQNVLAAGKFWNWYGSAIVWFIMKIWCKSDSSSAEGLNISKTRCLVVAFTIYVSKCASNLEYYEDPSWILCVYIYIYMYMYMYMYIYIYVYMYVYIYIYIGMRALTPQASESVLQHWCLDGLHCLCVSVTIWLQYPMW